MKRSNKILLTALTIGVVAGGALWWFIPALPWWLDVIAGVLFMATMHSQLRRQAARQAKGPHRG